MNVAVVTPHHDAKRSMFLDRLKLYMARQTRQPDQWIIVDDVVPFKPDLTYRVKLGCQRAVANGADLILIMEDDDWYAPDYIEFMVNGWQRMGKPELFGIGYTLYCNIMHDLVWFSPHQGRASLMSTMVTAKAISNYVWPKDNEIWLDIDLWKKLKGKTVEPTKYYSVGIKHGIGLCGGVGHNKAFGKYKKDAGNNELRKRIGTDYQWYQELKQSIKVFA